MKIEVVHAWNIALLVPTIIIFMCSFLYVLIHYFYPFYENKYPFYSMYKFYKIFYIPA